MQKYMRVALLFFFACPAFGQDSRGVKVGVCVDLDRLEAAQAAGFDYLELSVSRVAALSDEEFRELTKRAGALSIPIAAANILLPSGMKIVGSDIDKGRQMEYTAKALPRMRKLGVSLIVLGSGGARRVPDGFPQEEAFLQLADFCRRIAPLAKDLGMTIAVEPLRRQETNIINTVRDGLKLVKAVNLPQIRLLVDYYHLAEERENPEILLDARDYIVHAHIANPGGRAYPQDPAESDYVPFFEKLCRIGYAGRISIEASTTDFAVQAPRSIAMLRGLLTCKQ